MTFYHLTFYLFIFFMHFYHLNLSAMTFLPVVILAISFLQITFLPRAASQHVIYEKHVVFHIKGTPWDETFSMLSILKI